MHGRDRPPRSRGCSSARTPPLPSKNPRLDQRCTVVAQGGYGRGELNSSPTSTCCSSTRWKVNAYVETVTEIVLYALWDAGLQVGHAVRNVRECVRLAARDLKVKTALLDARYLCGDRPLVRRVRGAPSSATC